MPIRAFLFVPHGLAVLALLTIASCGAAPCDPDKEEPGTDCEITCDLVEGDPGLPCEREGQVCYYFDVAGCYTGICENGIWKGSSECPGGS
jgi:hypothetical protein